MEEYDLAIQYYKKVLSIDPNLKDIRKNIGFAYFKIGSIEKAFSFLKEELYTFPNNGDAYDLLTYILFKTN